MGLIEGFAAWGWWLGGYLVPFLFVLTIIVFFHELGHFMVARLCGVEVTAFSIGFGPEIAGFNDRHGTRWKFCPIPLGGYVKFRGDRNAASTGAEVSAMTAADRLKTFHSTTVGRRIAIAAAGPLANFVLAVVVFAAALMVSGRTITLPRLEEVRAQSPAAAAGFRPGDIILAVDGATIESFDDFQRIVALSGGEALKVVVERDGARITLDATPGVHEINDGFGGKARQGYIGVRRSDAPGDVRVVHVGPAEAVQRGAAQTWYIVRQTLDYIGKIAAHRESADGLGGPIKIAQISGKVATFGIGPLIELMAILSVSVGLLNLFPIPALDGGHLLFFAIEAVRGRPLSPLAQKWGTLAGVGMVLALVVFTTFNDIVRLAAS